MFKCKCGLTIDKIKYPNHLTSKRHNYFNAKVNIYKTFNIIKIDELTTDKIIIT